MPNLLADLTKRLKDNNKLAVASILIISDFMCIALSAFTAFQFRFPEKNLEPDTNPAIAQFDSLAKIVDPLLGGIITAISLAVGLAFGLGGQDAAAKYIERVKSDMSHK